MIKMNRPVGMLLVLATLGASAACNDEEERAADPLQSALASTGGSVHGRWKVTSFACDGQAQPIPTLTVNIQGDSGSFVIDVPGLCTSTISEAYAFPAESTIRITPLANHCSPEPAVCAPLFGGSPDCPVPAPTEFSYTVAADQLTFRRTSAGAPVDSCPAGQAVEYRMSRH
jgi:hypothetical protein